MHRNAREVVISKTKGNKGYVRPEAEELMQSYQEVSGMLLSIARDNTRELIPEYATE